MRVFLLPISTRRSLIYCERVSPSASPNAKPPLSERVINRAAQTWADWERANKGWRKYLVVRGNKLLSRIAFEEWGLKSFPPLTKARLEEVRNGNLKFECIYPSRFLSSAGSPKTTSQSQEQGRDEIAHTILSRFALERQNLHRRQMWTSLVWMPLTVPFTLVPVIPNIPFFYLCFRAYSHYRALYGGRFLAQLTSTPGSLAIRPSKELDEAFSRGLAVSNEEALKEKTSLSDTEIDTIVTRVMSGTENPDVGNEAMILQPWTGRILAEITKVPELQMEVERAVAQVQTSIEKAKREQNTQAQGANEKEAKR